MPMVTLNKEVFEKLVGKKLPLDELKDRISYLGTDLEGIEGNEIKVEIFPNRPDMLSEQGFARAFSSFIGVKTGLKKYEIEKTNLQLFVKDLPSEWPYAVACIIKGLKIDDERIREIIQIQEKLGTTYTRNRRKGGIGLYPLDKIKFPITFTGKKPEEIKFRPLEFPEKITAQQIIAKHPKGKEYGHIMNGWKTYPVFIDATNSIMSMPPLINSHDVGKIDETTTDVFLEGTGPDLKTLKGAITIIATALADMGGKIHSIEIIYPNERFIFPDLKPRKMKLDLKYANRLLGLELGEYEAKKLLERMGYGYEDGIVQIPAYRADILHQSDIAEDIAIAYGFDNFKEEMPTIATIGKENKLSSFKSKIARMLIGLGMLETNSYNITKIENQTIKMNTETMNEQIVELANALNADYNVMRAWMIPELLSVLSSNKHNEYPQKIFEIGTVFRKDKTGTGHTETGAVENERLCVATCHAKADFTEIKQVLDYIFNALDMKYEIKETEHDSFITGRVGRVSVGGKDIAYIGEVHPQVLANWELTYPTAMLELNITDLFEIMNSFINNEKK